MKNYLCLLLICFSWKASCQCTTYASSSPVEFSGTCTETQRRNHNGTGVLTISGELTFSADTFFVRGPVVVTGSLNFTGSAVLSVRVNGSIQVSSGGSISAQSVEVGANSNLTLNTGSTMGATTLVNDFKGPLDNTITVDGELTVDPGNFTNNTDGVIAGTGVINADVIDSGSSTFTGTLNGSCTGNCDAALPVELVTFSVSQRGNVNELRWSTASEIDNEGFVVQRRMDLEGEDFEDIGFVKGNGTSKERHEYSFLDLDANRMSHYRLRQVDYDGKFEYSHIVHFEPKHLNVEQVFIYPTSFDGQFSFGGWSDNIYGVELFSGNGDKLLSLVSSSKKDAESSIASLLTNSAKGVYIVSVRTNSQVFSLRLVNL